MIKLGDKVRDKISGLAGLLVIARMEKLYGSSTLQVWVQQMQSTQWLEEQQCEVSDAKPLASVSQFPVPI